VWSSFESACRLLPLEVQPCCLEPGTEPGSGIEAASDCSEDVLDLNWQRLIATHIMEREHPGVLTGLHYQM